MERILSILMQLSVSDEQAMLIVLVILLLLMLVFTLWVRGGARPSFRPIPGFAALRGLIGQVAETSQALHVSLGIEGVGGKGTAETLAGLTVLEYLARHMAVCDAPPIVTVADPSLLPIAQDALRHAYLQYCDVDYYDPSQVRFIAPQAVAYATGVMGVLGREKLRANVMVGSFGDEYLLMGETGARRDVSQIVGTANPQTLPFVFTSADQTLIGEEMYAAGAYLASLPAHVGSLIAQDWVRVFIVLFIIIGVIGKTFL